MFQLCLYAGTRVLNLLETVEVRKEINNAINPILFINFK